MNKTNKVSPKSSFAFICAALACILIVQCRTTHEHSTKLKSHKNSAIFPTDTSTTAKKNNNPVGKMLKSENDTFAQKIVRSGDTIHLNDSLVKRDTSALTKNEDTIRYKISKNAPDTSIAYTAEDSMVVDVPGKTITLYGTKATTEYKDNKLTAPIISLDQQTGNINAALKRDSTGKVIAFPTFVQKDFTSESDSISFNMKSSKGFTKSTYTKQGDMYVYGQIIKKVDTSVFYAYRARFTTCDLDTPHFAFVANRVKFITNKVAITGPVHPEFEGVPLPIYFPFGIYPLNNVRHSGLLEPTFTTNQQRGVGLEDLGYYKVINDYWDIIFRGSIYSYGGWTLSINPRYMKKYHYSGNLEFDVQNFNTNFKGDPDFSHNRSYHILWTDNLDTKARPGVTFTASVNAGSSSYNRNVPNSATLNFTNQMYSSIAFSKTWKKSNLTISANHNQNTNLGIINVNLPTVAYSIQTIYPFRKKDAVGASKWYDNIGIGYQGAAQSLFSFYDSLPNIFKQIKDTLQYGAHHTVPISLSLPPLGAFQIAPSVSYDETWYQTRTRYYWDSAAKKVDTSIQKGFYTARNMTFGLSISTRIFGLITAKNKNAKIKAVRHELTPTIGISYKPDFTGNTYYNYQFDSLGHISPLTSVYQRNLYGPYSPGKFGGLTFSIDNNISAKVKDKKDTTGTGLKKINLIDGLSIS
ncbi:MAG TPA: putative LPS assembly protein LptD, partial [Chitinophagaceae bacterium]|nr:putative LPS assembly protein LptD [Chitinophagaceae bacterium]